MLVFFIFGAIELSSNEKFTPALRECLKGCFMFFGCYNERDFLDDSQDSIRAHMLPSEQKHNDIVLNRKKSHYQRIYESEANAGGQKNFNELYQRPY